MEDETRERQRLQALASRAESEAAAARRDARLADDRARQLAAQVDAAQREAMDAHALLEASNGRAEVLEAAWHEALEAARVGGIRLGCTWR
jgi:hypothetical protein